MAPRILEDLALCTFSTGTTLVREVLGDWVSFLGGRPRQVVFSVAPADHPPAVYEALRSEGAIDEIVPVAPAGRSLGEVDLEALRRTVEAANTEWILLVKLDTLPWRVGFDDWLERAFEVMIRQQCLGITGSGTRYFDVRPAAAGYSKVQRYSNNFSIMRRVDWLEIQDFWIGRDFDGPLLGEPALRGSSKRYATEVAVERHLREHDRWMLVRWESLDWSVFHVNLWGDRLAAARDRYRARLGVAPFLFQGEPQEDTSGRPWKQHFGHPRPSTWEQLKRWVGR